jgi:hypothetical protein
LDVQLQWVTALAWPRHKGMMEGCLCLTTDILLVGRTDGSLAVIKALDYSTFRREELTYCKRSGGEKLAFITALPFIQLCPCSVGGVARVV